MQQKLKSIDGISPAPSRRAIYIARESLERRPPRVVTFQQRPKADTKTKKKSTQPTRFVDNDVVVRLPRSRVIYARVLSLIQYVGFALVAILSAGNSTLGQYFVAAYAIYALVLRKNSQQTFLLALILLISIPVFSLLKQTGVADNMAIYTYELLVVGTVQAIVELKWPAKVKSSV